MVNLFLKRIAKGIPGLALKLKQAGMSYTPEQFVKRTLLSAFYMTTGVTFLLGSIMAKLEIFLSALYIITPVMFITIFLYFLVSLFSILPQ